jgi:hypothetical protein
MKSDDSDRYLAIFAQYYADIDTVESTSDLRRVADGGYDAGSDAAWHLS